MFKTIMSFLGMGSKLDVTALMQRGAQIIDVRTPEEFRHGNIKGSLNLPLSHLKSQLKKIKKDKPVITCCRSGARSGSAKQFLESNGYTEVYNGGGWVSLQRKIKMAKS